jgi:two-component system phosphate regulon response regulator PhoB
VLVIDADKEHVKLLRHTLTANNYDVIAAGRGDTGLEIALRHKPDLILLEVKIPGVDGLEVCRRLRRDDRGFRIPVIILSALGGEMDRVVGLELGADDYITKPFSPRELVARVKSLLRRVSAAAEPCEVRRCGDLVLDTGRREVTYRGNPIPLTAAEFRILECLLNHPGRVLSRSEILRIVHADDVAVADRTIDVHVGYIRRKLGSGGQRIETMRGFGYRLRDDQESAAGPRSGESSTLSPFGWGRGRRLAKKPLHL